MKRVTLISMDGFDAVNVTECLFFKENLSEDDIKRTIQEAAEEYCMNEEGKDALERNADYFSLEDLINYVPEEICLKHGFYLITPNDNIPVVIDANESLYITKNPWNSMA